MTFPLQKFGRTLVLGIAVLAMAMGSAMAKKRDDKTKNEYPNATRVEPKLELSERTKKNLDKAQELMQAEEDESLVKAETLLMTIINNAKSKPYEKAVAYTYMSQLSYNRDDVEKALEWNQKAIDINALDNRMHFGTLNQLAQMFMFEEKYDKALVALDQYVKLSGVSDAKSDAIRGNALMRLGRYDEAIVALKKALTSTDKPNPQWQELLIGTYFEKEDYTGAAAYAESVLAKDPTNTKIMQHLSQVYLQLDQEPKALALLEKAYKAGQLTTEAELKQLFQLYNYVEPPRSTDAIALINDEMTKGRLKPGVDTYRSLADAYLVMEQIDQAIEAYTKASTYAKDGEMDLQRAHLMIQEKDQFNEGKALIQTALQRGIKRQGTAWLLIGTAEYNLEHNAAAIAAFQKARTFPETQKAADTWLKNLKAR